MNLLDCYMHDETSNVEKSKGYELCDLVPKRVAINKSPKQASQWRKWTPKIHGE